MHLLSQHQGEHFLRLRVIFINYLCIIRLSRKTKEAATIYMELLGQKWMSTGDEDDEDDEDVAMSLFSFPELRRQSGMFCII